jgi:hypothetical protein
MRNSRQLHRDGKHRDAYQQAMNAFEVMNEHANAGDPASCAFVVCNTPYLDSLAKDAGHAGANSKQITDAMRMYESMYDGMVNHSPKVHLKANALLEWYRDRQAESAKAQGL